ncbi:MAG: transcriptional regulator [Sphingomonas bacterium]|nr:transcriptional regulator [Sphingomonas bacterium]
MTDEIKNEILGLTADIVAAHVANNRVATNEVSDLITQVHAALSGLASPKTEAAPEQQPAVPVRSSVKHDYIVCLEDGKKLKMLKRYLRTNYDMTPEEYRTKWKLPRDYPMVAPAYAEQRRGLARKIGLGRKKTVDAVATPAAAAPAKTAPAKAAPKPRAKKAAAAPATNAAPATPAKRGRPPKMKVAAPTEA